MKTHPDEVFKALKEKRKRGRGQWPKFLDIVHTVCREIYDERSKDYSLPTIALKGKDRNGPMLGTLRSKKLFHYRKLIEAWAERDGCKVIPARGQLGQSTDPTFSWVHKVCAGAGGKSPLEEWRVLCTRYMEYLNKGYGEKSYPHRLLSLRLFLERYLWVHKFFDPLTFLTLPPTAIVPPLLGDKGVTSFLPHDGRRANQVHDFINWVIDHDDRFSSDEDGVRVTLPGVRNPFTRGNGKGGRVYSESVRTVLPYKYIMALREMLAPGEYFRDWQWAQAATGSKSGLMAGDWFEVDPDIIDETDPDCVWRMREIRVIKRPNTLVGHRIITEMWSPVAAVALLLKLEMPLRTHQVRMLDSGETDVERVELTGRDDLPFEWRDNRHRTRLLAGLNVADASRVNKAQGVFRRFAGLREGDMVGFFINTNKTADIDKDWAHRGYQISWQHTPMLRWLIKLRNWQEKYNPLTKPTLWTELHWRHYGSLKSIAEVVGASPSCFLFRNASAHGKTKARSANDETKPITDSAVDDLWSKLLLELEEREKRVGSMDSAGKPIQFVKSDGNTRITYYPLHSLRVSLITALAFEGGVSLQTLMKLAGHSRIIMTIYYAKISASVMTDTMQKAQEQMAARADSQVIAWLKERSYAELGTCVIGDDKAMAAALPNDPLDRTAAGFLRVLGGWCLVGGNTVADDVAHSGCWNGGACTNDAGSRFDRIHRPVKPRHCIESGCRWFVSRPEYLPEIKARLDLLLANLASEQSRFNKAQDYLESIQAEKCRAEQDDASFTRSAELDRAARLYEKSAASLDEILSGIGYTVYLLERCVDLAKKPPVNTDAPDQLVAVGTIDDIQWALTSTDSELLQLTGVCLNAEVYPELESESENAVLRRSQLLDRILEPEHGQALSSLNPDEQLRLGNRILRTLAKHTGGSMEPVIELLESGQPIPEAFRESLTDELKNYASPPAPTPLFQLLKRSAA